MTSFTFVFIIFCGWVIYSMQPIMERRKGGWVKVGLNLFNSFLVDENIPHVYIVLEAKEFIPIN